MRRGGARAAVVALFVVPAVSFGVSISVPIALAEPAAGGARESAWRCHEQVCQRDSLRGGRVLLEVRDGHVYATGVEESA